MSARARLLLVLPAADVIFLVGLFVAAATVFDADWDFESAGLLA